MPGYFDTVLVCDGNEMKMSIEGIFSIALLYILTNASFIIGHQIAQIRVIFSLPERLIRKHFTGTGTIPRFFAYIEWFTAFEKRLPNHGLYRIKCKIRRGDRVV